MNQKEMAEIALNAVEEGLGYEKLKSNNYLYCYKVNEIWPLVEECKNYGMIPFIEKYQLRK